MLPSLRNAIFITFCYLLDQNSITFEGVINKKPRKNRLITTILHCRMDINDSSLFKLQFFISNIANNEHLTQRIYITNFLSGNYCTRDSGMYVTEHCSSSIIYSP